MPLVNADPTTLTAAFRSSGVRDDADISYLVESPHFQTWIHDLLTDPSACIPTEMLSVNFSNFPTKATYRQGVMSFRKIAADWLVVVDGKDAVYSQILETPDALFQDRFPPEGIDSFGTHGFPQ